VLAAASAVAVVGAIAWFTHRAPTTDHVVVAGDTLSKLATTYGVTVEDLRTWNGLSGDLIVVGQVLVVGREAPAERTAPAVPAPRASTGDAAPHKPDSLEMPVPEACIPFDPSLGDQDIVSPDGLEPHVLSASLEAVLPAALERCSGPPGPFAYRYALTVGCDGVVASVDGGDDELGACIADVLRYADFPAHDIAGGMRFDYPVSGEL